MNETVRQLAVDVTNHIANQATVTGLAARNAKREGMYAKFLHTMWEQANPVDEEDIEIAEKVMSKVLGEYYELVKNLTLDDFED